MIICIVGPTAVGKTKLSIELAKKYNAIIVNSDAMQVYKNLNIGTAKVREDEKENISHYLFDIKDVEDSYTVYDYQKDARSIIEKYSNRNIIFVGGTGLYLKAALYNYYFLAESKSNDYNNITNEELYEMALKKDTNLKIHVNNRQRLIRFLNKENVNCPEPVKLYDHIMIGLTTERDILYERINNRVDIMFENGLLDEVKSFYEKHNYSKPLICGIGYKELYNYFDGIVTLEEAKEKIKQNSRRYAKRQYTFFKNQFDVKWFDVNFGDFYDTINKVIDFIERESKND